jgi:hypothetical protein
MKLIALKWKLRSKNVFFFLYRDWGEKEHGNYEIGYVCGRYDIVEGSGFFH